MTEKAKQARSILTLLIAVFALNFALGFYNYWPTPWIALKAQFSSEAMLLILLLVLMAWWGRPVSKRGATWLALLLIVLVVGRYLDVTAPALYGRPINLYWDSQHLPAVVAMLARAASWPQLLGTSLIVLLAFASLFWLLYRVVLRLASGSAHPQHGRWLAGGAMTVLTVWCLGSWFKPPITERWFTRAITVSWAQQLNHLHQTVSEELAQDFAVSPLPESDLSSIHGADVLVMFVESYGVTTVDKPEHASALLPALTRLQKATEESGRNLASGRITSPTFAGASWLAHSSFLAGYEVSDNAVYEHLLASSRKTWIQVFAAAGYRTLGLMPGIRSAWPEGQYYQFDKIYDAQTLDYQGTEFGWWRIPDQYSLAKLDALEMAPGTGRKPVLAFFTTVSSHAPFRPVAPFESDWAELLQAQAYQSSEAEQALAQRPDWLNLAPAYLESITYALDTAAGYLEHRRDDDLVMIIVGDHQPTASVTGPQVSWEVPIHVISNRKPMIDSLVEIGLSSGVRPSQTGLGPMHKFSAALLQLLGGGGPLQPGVDVSGAISGLQPG